MATLTAPIGGSLYELTDYINALFESLEGLEESDPLRAECQSQIDAYLQAEVQKVDNVAGYLARCEAEQQFAAAEIQRLQDRRRQWEKRQERLEEYVMGVMQTAGKARLDGRANTLSVRKSPASVEVLDQALVPEQYIRVTVTESVDKSAAKQAMAAGAEVPGLKLVTDRKHLRRS